MFDRKTAKKQAKHTLKKHYLLFVTACLFASLLGAAYTSSLSSSTANDTWEIEEVTETGTSQIGLPEIGDVIARLYDGVLPSGIKIAEKIFKDEEKIEKFGEIELGRQKGVLSQLVNMISSGQFLVLLYQTILSVVQSQKLATDLFIILTAMVLSGIAFFARYTYQVAFHRIFLESYLYDKVDTSRFLFLFKVRKVLKSSMVIFTTALIRFFCTLTIIGGPIAHYSFFMVPYITAENPDISSDEARKLSKRMMYGHKWEMFKLDLSFIFWHLLGHLTLGFSDILYANPYREATYVQYYFHLRQLAKENGASYADRMNDVYLSQKPDYPTVERAYEDVIDIMTDEIDVRDMKHDGLRGFIEDRLGIVWKYDKAEEQYNTAVEQEEKIKKYHQILDLKQYPDRLFTIPENRHNPRLQHLHYMRHYSLWSIIVIFFVFCMIGWIYEVMLHIVRDGTFVNRGFLHGPWLPIYGFGGILILTLLFCFRNRPFLHAMLTVILCGTVEYFTHWFLELTKGIQWWNYSGYFINLHGRICAEGLLIFMLGGMAVVYVGAPWIDDRLKKIKKQILIPVSLILLLLFDIDAAYSFVHPNTGKGITDYNQDTYKVTENYRI
ncbi:MAG: DUF975 family protein [Erysipelotrichaceae bacterium]|nr:DUF975 family protein [Erysipelotrichaceae bacterium]